MNKKLENLVSHATTHKFWQQDTSGLSSTQVLRQFSNRAICPRCERFAYRDKGWDSSKYARCPACGWSGKTITIDEYISAKLYR